MSLFVRDKIKSISNKFPNVFFSEVLCFSNIYFTDELLETWTSQENWKCSFIHVTIEQHSVSVSSKQSSEMCERLKKIHRRHTYLNICWLKNHSFSAVLRGHGLEKEFPTICTDEISFAFSTHWNRLCVFWTILASLFCEQGCQAVEAYLPVICGPSQGWQRRSNPSPLLLKETAVSKLQTHRKI